MSAIDLERDPLRGRLTVDGRSLIVHCNHFNRSLQELVDDIESLSPDALQQRAAEEASFDTLSTAFAAKDDWDAEARSRYAEAMFARLGFGRLALKAASAGGTATTGPSHYSQTLSAATGGTSSEHFDRGFVLGAVQAIHETAFEITQDTSMVGGAEVNAFTLAPKPEATLPDIERRPVTGLADAPPIGEFDTRIDEAAILAALDEPMPADEDGLIRAFGVVLVQMFADYYNKVSFRYAQGLGEMLGDSALASEMLIEAGHICGFNTMGGIMESTEWDALIRPNCDTKEDWIHGIVACINSLGWGVWRVRELSEARMVLRIYHPYESVGHLEFFGRAEHPVDLTSVGVAASVMNLVYRGKIEAKPSLDPAYYHSLFADHSGYWGKQTKCAAMGAEYSEIVVERR